MMAWMLEPLGMALTIVAIAVLSLLYVWAHVSFWARRLGLPLSYDCEEVLPTPDGNAIELRRIDGSKPGSGLPPVLLVHGICANHRNQDISPDASLARFLAALGRDVWLLTLRSGRARPWRELPRPSGFSTMTQHDVPMGINRVLEITGAAHLDYVGFSMGGMLLYASLGRTVDPSVLRRVAFVGSPGRVQPPVGVPRFLRFLPRLFVPPVLTGMLGTGFAFLAEWIVTPMHRMILNPKNMAKGMTQLALVECVQDVPGGLLADFMVWATNDGVIRIDGGDVLDALNDVGVPALFIAGADDRVGTPRAVRAAFEAWASHRADIPKAYLVLGKASGAMEDYGHGDLAVGERLSKELFPLIGAFLETEAKLLPAVLEHGEVRS
jgi:poly[(R)-3-hydroxyalkanoate] polymerase subunit PhaC